MAVVTLTPCGRPRCVRTDRTRPPTTGTDTTKAGIRVLVMRTENVPAADARFWRTLLAASLLGTAAGDFAADTVGLGFLAGPPVLSIAVTIVLLAERRISAVGTGFYWTAIVLTRIAATNTADFLTHARGLGLGFAPVALALAAALALVARRDRVVVDGRYWATIAIASLLGTVGGDWLSDSIGLRWAALAALPCVAAPALWRNPRSVAGYWLAVAGVRVAGTIWADLMAAPDGLALGLGGSLAAAALFLAAALAAPKRRRRPASARARAARAAG